METCLPASAKTQSPEQVDRLRFAVRAEGGRGFVFMHQFQNHVPSAPDLADVSLTVAHAGGTVRFPQEGGFSLKSGRSAILPFHFEVGALVLRSATAQPLTVLTRRDGRHHVFFSIDGIAPEFVWGGSPTVVGEGIEVLQRDGQTTVRSRSEIPFLFECGGEKILVLTQAMATRALRFDDALYISDFDLFLGETGIEVRSIGALEGTLTVYPTDVEVRCSGVGAVERKTAACFLGEYAMKFTSRAPRWTCERIGGRRLLLNIEWPAAPEVGDLWIQAPFIGDRVEAYIQGRLVGDHFYNGFAWELGLRKFKAAMAADGLVLF